MKPLLFLLFLPCISWAQKSLEAQNKALLEENAALKKENALLRKHLQVLASWDTLMKMNEQSPLYAQEQQLTAQQKEAQLLQQIANKDAATQAQAARVKQLADEFEQYCDQLRDTLTVLTGGKNAQGHFIGKRNKTAVHQFMLVEGNAALLAHKMQQLRKQLLELAPATLRTIDVSTFEHPDKSWGEYNFGSMPFAAVYPMLGKMRNDAVRDKLRVLELLAFAVEGK